MKVKISAVIITYNEEQNIGRCLESIKDVVDEIVVVDSYSSDRTGEICRSYDAVFIQHRFTGYIEQKNWAVQQAASPYILSLDADEALSDELKVSLQKVREDWTHDAYYFNRLTCYCGKWIRHTSWYPARKLRLWDSGMGSWGGNNPHDRFVLYRGARSRFLKGDLLHYSYYSVEEHLAQVNSFSTIMARSYFEQGRKAGFLSLTLRPFWRFLNDFVFLRGFLDGYYGYIVSINSAHEVFMKYVKLRNLYREHQASSRQTICFFNSHPSWGGGERWHLDMITSMAGLHRRIIYISSPSSPLARKLLDLDVTGYQLRLNNLSFLNPFKLFQLCRIFRKERVGILLTNLSCDMKVASLAARFSGVPVILYRRGSAIPVSNTWLNRYLFRKVITHVVANSKETRRTILANNNLLVPEHKIRVIYNGVKLSRYHPGVKPMYERNEGEIILGSAGRLSEEKGHKYLLEMMSRLKKDAARYKLLIAGEGEIQPSLEQTAMELDVKDRVEFLGYVEDMPSFYNSVDIFILPSRFEGFGYVLAEAMASRKPVVAFDIKSSAEIIEDGETGFIAEAFQVAEMSSKVRQLARDKELRERMGEKGRARVEALFSFKKNFADFRDMLSL